ncbi:HPr family phosphocarrier protein [Psychrobacillus sp. L4]|uniref:HPr family phosphocarrier protein n=1 Tax=Psychrobacillus sp. L4 TaxID=3236892 RepID=UPI0036F24548
MEKNFKVITPEGLHARLSALLVVAVTPYTSNVKLSYNGKSVNLKSIMGVMSQGIGPGAVITISAQGGDAEELIGKVTEVMISERLGEEC